MNPDQPDNTITTVPEPRPKGNIVYVLTQGHAWNPLREWPRNELCFCNSGRKAKACCLPHQPAVIDEKDAAELTKALKFGTEGRQAIRREYQRHRDEQAKKTFTVEPKP